MTSLGRRQAVSQRLLVPSFHRFESCRPSITKEFSENNRKLFFFTLEDKSWVDRIRTEVSVRKKCEQWRSIFCDSGTGGARKRTFIIGNALKTKLRQQVCLALSNDKCRRGSAQDVHDRRGESCRVSRGCSKGQSTGLGIRKAAKPATGLSVAKEEAEAIAKPVVARPAAKQPGASRYLETNLIFC